MSSAVNSFCQKFLILHVCQGPKYASDTDGRWELIFNVIWTVSRPVFYKHFFFYVSIYILPIYIYMCKIKIQIVNYGSAESWINIKSLLRGNTSPKINLTLSTPTPQYGQTHSNNSSATADQFAAMATGLLALKGWIIIKWREYKIASLQLDSCWEITLSFVRPVDSKSRFRGKAPFQQTANKI